MAQFLPGPADGLGLWKIWIFQGSAVMYNCGLHAYSSLGLETRRVEGSGLLLNPTHQNRAGTEAASGLQRMSQEAGS